MKASLEAPATHYRLSPETWAQVVEDYLDGATAKAVAAKWKTSAGSVYRWARELHPGGKRGHGDARARAHARVVEAEEASVRGMHSVGSRALNGLFSPEAGGRPDAGNPEVLMRLATVASGRAMTGRLWAEAKALAGLAESYGRLAARGEPTIETLPVKLIYDILYDKRAKAEGRFGMHPSDNDPPEARAAKTAYWKRYALDRAREEDRVRQLDALVADAECFQQMWKANWAEMMADETKRATAEKAIEGLKAEGLEIDPATGLPPRPKPKPEPGTDGASDRGPRIRLT